MISMMRQDHRQLPACTLRQLLQLARILQASGQSGEQLKPATAPDIFKHSLGAKGFPACGSPLHTCFVLSCRAVWSSGVFCVLCAAFIFALTALLVKLTGGRVPVLEITLYRSAISLVVSAGETHHAQLQQQQLAIAGPPTPSTTPAAISSSLSPSLATLSTVFACISCFELRIQRS